VQCLNLHLLSAAPHHPTTSRFSSATYKWNIHSYARYCVVHCAFPACESTLNQRCFCTSIMQQCRILRNEGAEKPGGK
jgi:hypothetical protein